MSKFRYIVRAATIGATALLLGASLSAAEEYWHPSLTPKQAVAEGPSVTTKHAAPSRTARMRNRAAFANMAQPSTAKSKDHRLILQVNTNDPAAMNLALNNAMNVTQYYKDLREKVKIEVITFGPGLHMLREDTSPVKARIESMALSTPEVSFKACGNTQENMRKAENKDIPIIPQAQVVKSGVVRVMELEEQGWTYVKP
jgi:intracellular sulfur oxidation DsrE/DsrF family protein